MSVRWFKIFLIVILFCTPLAVRAESASEPASVAVSDVEASPVPTLYADTQQKISTSGQQMVALPIGNDVYAAGALVQFHTPVADDAYLAGAAVTITNDVGSDLVVAGGNITIMGNVADDLRVVGGNIVLGGKVGGSLVVVGGTVQVLPSAVISDDVVLAGGAIDFAGTAERNLLVRGGAFSLSGEIHGDAKITAEETFTATDAAKIVGTLEYSTPKSATLSPKLASKIIYTPLPAREFSKFKKGDWAEMRFFGELFFLALIFMTGLVLLALSGRSAARFTGVARKHFWLALFIGALLIFSPIVVVPLLMLTIVGSFLGVIFFLCWLLLMLLAGIFSGLTVGSFIFPLEPNSSYVRRVAVFALGLVLLTVVSFIPVFGWMFRFVAYVITLGAIVLARRELYKQLKKDKIV